MRILATIAIFLLAACSTTSVKDSWKDPAFAGPPVKKVMVIGVSKSDANRRIFEDGFARALQAAGVSAVPAYPELPESGAIAGDRITGAVAKTGADAVLVTRVLRVTKNVNVSPGYMAPGFYGRGYRGYYGGAWATMPPDVNVYDVLTLETTLWNTATDKPLWSGTTELNEPKSVSAATDELANVLIAKMKADGVI
jgi:hypothetical protein